MFKKRIKAAKIVFFTIVALTVFAVVLLKNSERHGKGTGELKVFFGNPDIVDGVTVKKGVSECVWMDNTRYADHESALREADHFYKTQTVHVAGDKTVTSLEYGIQKEPKYRVAYVSLQDDEVERLLIGAYGDYVAEGLSAGKKYEISNLSYDVIWLLNDGFYPYKVDMRKILVEMDIPYKNKNYRIKDYVTFAEADEFWFFYDVDTWSGARLEYYDGVVEEGLGDSWIEAELGSLTYSGIDVQEHDGAFYAFMDMEPDCFGTPKFHMTVNKGIYRLATDGTASCVFLMGERAEGFEFLWLTKEEEENTLAIIGKKENCLVAYCYNLESGAVEERVLWDGQENPKEFLEWWETAKLRKMADMETEGEKNYICYTDGESCSGEVNVIVFEGGDRIFFGEILPEERECGSLTDFSGNTNGESVSRMVVDKLEITLQK